MYISEEQLKHKVITCEYPPRFQITCEQVGGAVETLPDYVVSKKLQNKETEEIGSFPLRKNIPGIKYKL